MTTPNQNPNLSGYNFLVLGETGVGKTTFINAFANYQDFPTAQDAIAGKLRILIPASFTVADNDGEPKTIVLGNPNETRQDGESDTQDCKAYVFQSNGRLIKLIDTPGIGDTRGLKQDRINSQKILSFASHYPVLHGILILLKPNVARINNSFRFCVMELLCNLHKNASDNIVFLFTNGRGTSYRPGETIVPLNILLKEIKTRNPNLDIKANKNTMYTLDNEGFRFVAGTQNGIVYSQDEITPYTKSWAQASAECLRLVNHVVSLPPHNVADSLSVNEARRMIVGFTRPLADITFQIGINKVIVEEQEKKLNALGGNMEQLRRQLFMPSVELSTVPYERPITVCISPGCFKIKSVNGIDQMDYETKCHDPCYLPNVTPNLNKNEDLRHCSAMVKGVCKKCGCNWDVHMQIHYRNVMTLKENTSSHNTANTPIKEKQRIILDLEKQRGQLTMEQTIITQISARFAHFLEHTAIAPYNDATEDYLDHLVEGEKTKIYEKDVMAKVLKHLETMKKAHNEEKKILKEKMKAESGYTDNAITPNSISENTKQLFKLPINGPIIFKMVMEFEESAKKEHNSFSEVVYDPTAAFAAMNISQ